MVNQKSKPQFQNRQHSQTEFYIITIPVPSEPTVAVVPFHGWLVKLNYPRKLGGWTRLPIASFLQPITSRCPDEERRKEGSSMSEFAEMRQIMETAVADGSVASPSVFVLFPLCLSRLSIQLLCLFFSVPSFMYFVYPRKVFSLLI
jgi:hypothetical protein